MKCLKRKRLTMPSVDEDAEQPEILSTPARGIIGIAL